MADPRDQEFIGPYQGDVYAGHLSTPISDSGLVKAFINNLPIYRQGLAPFRRGLEVGAAHGYFLVGPWVLLGPLRDSEAASNLGALLSGIGLVLILTITLSIYGSVIFPREEEGEDSRADYLKNDSRTPEDLKNSRGWSDYTAGFFIGGTGGAIVAYLLIENFAAIDSMFRGMVN